MTDALLENREDWLATAQLLHDAQEDLPWAWGRLLWSLSRPQMDDIVTSSPRPGRKKPRWMGWYYTAAVLYPWFPDEDDQDHPGCLTRAQTLTYSHHRLLYIQFLAGENPDHAAAEMWLQRAESESWKLWQLKKALGGGDPTPKPFITVRVPGKRMTPTEAWSSIFTWAEHREGIEYPGSFAEEVEMMLTVGTDAEVRRAVASLMRGIE